ncbi:SURF1 family protein [Cellulomonas wangsupingiae]|uniref:SURF1 family protein n=1 Tax=Cellulomonas wangsupingiae TaxID=2968085 RepID=UPI001D0EBDC9|nr:SURF1 family protein [Cellulomonas wangsupingiae]MCM0639815.1 SURF1 family protein [Cellulomonas wangsupingiae]
MADTPTSLWRAALRPRMLGLLVVLLAAAAVCARLGVWQLERAEVRGALSADREAERILSADPEPLADLLAPGDPFVGDLVARKAVVTGTYDDDATLLVTGRSHDTRSEGNLVLTPLLVPTDEGTAVLPVVRGWTAGDDVPSAPDGPVEVVGWLQVGEAAGDPVVDGRTDAISPAQLLTTWGGPVYTGYLVVQTSDPADPAAQAGLEPLDPPTRAGSGLNIQNLAYAAQWWIFGLFVAALWWRLVRDEAAGRPLLPGDAPAEAEAEALAARR